MRYLSRGRSILLSGICLTLHTSAATSEPELIATCGASKGYSYYVEGGLIPKESAGYQEDGISRGSIQLLLDGNEADIVQIDGTDTRRSAKDEGGSVLPVVNGSNIAVLVLYQGVVENYVFRMNTSEVTWSKSTFGYSLDKHSVLRAPCVFE